MADPIRKIKLKNGATRWRFVVDVGADPKTGKRRQLTRTFDLKSEAVAEYGRIQHQRRTGSFVVPTKLTLDQWLDQWLKSVTRDVEDATARNYADAVRPAREHLGAHRLQELTEPHIESLIDWMLTGARRRGGKAGTGLGLRSVRLTLGRLKSALDEAVRQQLVVRNVAERARIPRAAREAAKEQQKKRVPWSEDEVRVFLKHVAGDRLHAVMLLSLLGLRPAEVCGLRWSDVDLDAGTLTVATTRTMVAGRVVEKAAKSDAGMRTLPLPAVATAALRVFHRLQAAERLLAGEAYAASGRVVVDELGGAVRTDWLRRRAYRLMEGAGVRRVRLYDARHACCTWLAASGVPDVVVSAWAGHSDLSFTKRTYVHPSPEHLRAAADHMQTVLSGT